MKLLYFCRMKSRCRYNRLIALVLMLLLCGALQGVRAQEFTVDSDHIPVKITPDSGITMRYDMTPLYHAVKYHGYYFLKLHVHCLGENPTKYWDESILVALSEKDKTSRKVAMPDEFNGSMSHTADLFVRNDTLWLKSSLSYRKSENHSGYYFDESNWTWKYEQEVSDLAFEDDRYWVFGRQYVRFIEKQTTWEANTSNGWLQMEPINIQYDRFGMPTRILHSDGQYYFVHRCQVRTRQDDLSPGGRIRRNTMINDPILSDVYKNTYLDGHYIEDYIDKDSILYDVTKRKSTYRYSNYYVDGYGHGDTVFDGAFCVDNLIYLVVSVPHKTFIARLDNSRLTPVVDFGRHFEIAPSALQISTLNRQNMEPDKCLLIFNAKYGSSECGLIDIDGTTVKVVHFDFPSQNLGTYPPVHSISTPN